MTDNIDLSLVSLNKINDVPNESKQNTALPIPTDLIASLAASVKDLRDSVSQLCTENDRLQQELNSVKLDLVTLQRNAGARFPHFSRLPEELRRYVLL
jgi:hypothetical protein